MNSYMLMNDYSSAATADRLQRHSFERRHRRADRIALGDRLAAAWRSFRSPVPAQTPAQAQSAVQV